VLADLLLLVGLRPDLLRLLGLRGPELDQPDGREDVEEELQVLRLPVLHDIDGEGGRGDEPQQGDLLQALGETLVVEGGHAGEGLADEAGEEQPAEGEAQPVVEQESSHSGHRPSRPMTTQYTIPVRITAR
jgi:hypothetical protein